MSEEMKAIIEEMKELVRHEIIDVDGATLALLPECRRIENLQPYIDALLDAPKRIRGTVPLSTVSALIDYMNRFKRPDSVVFASDAGGNGASPQLVGIVDFHGQGPAAQPAFGEHRATYLFPRSDQMAAWSAVSGKGMSHDEFASFLQERQYDIVNPPLDWMAVDPKTIELLLHLLNISDDYGATDATLDRPAGKSGMTARDHRDGAGDEVVEPPDDRYMPRSALYKLRAIRWGTAQRLQQLARTLEVSVNSVATEGYSPKTGERTIKFVEEHTTRDATGRQVIVPDAFLLSIPIWEGETPTLVPVTLQYRKKGGSLLWFLVLSEWRRVVRFAVKTEAERVRDATQLPIFFGKPSA